MPLTLIKEDGTGKVDANAYADLADGNAYHDGHLYASAWTAATDSQKTIALVMATRLIDAEMQFNGSRANVSQALQWPRELCPDPDNVSVPLSVLVPMPSGYVPYNTVPKVVVQATCELARELLIADRTLAPPGEGLKYFNNAAVQSGYDKSDTPAVLSRVALVMVAKYGSQIRAKSGVVKLIRT